MGSSFAVYRNFDYTSNPDCFDYMSMAKFDYKPTNPVRRYRPIVPTIVYFVNIPISNVFYKIWNDKDTAHEWPLRLSFFLVNCLIMSVTGYLIFHFTYQYTQYFWPSLFSVLAFTSTIWCAYITGMPMADSIYHLTLVMLYFGLLFNNKLLLYTSICIGPFAKESFVFFIPVIIWFVNGYKIQSLLIIAVSLGAVLLFRMYIDTIIGVTQQQSIQSDLEHFNSILFSLRKIFSIKGALDLFSVFGFFALPLFYLKKCKLESKIILLNSSFLVIIIVHMLLSSEVSRMFYFYAAPFCLMLTICINKIYYNYKNLSKTY